MNIINLQGQFTIYEQDIEGKATIKGVAKLYSVDREDALVQMGEGLSQTPGCKLLALLEPQVFGRRRGLRLFEVQALGNLEGLPAYRLKFGAIIREVPDDWVED